MDTALQLRIEVDHGQTISSKQAVKKLQQSELVNKLTKDLSEKPLFYIWRLIALSEIPYAQHLDYTKKLIDRIYNKLATEFGFSLSGDEKYFLPCYNAMLVSALCRLGEGKSRQVASAVEWINKYQPMKRGIRVSVPNMRFDRFGGCFKNTPCYIGVAKSVFALFDYQQATGYKSVNQKLERGIEYLLNHGLINRLHNNGPITQHILDISFPATYHLNIVELVRFASKSNILSDSRTKPAIDYLLSKKTKNNTWKISYRYKSEGYIVFDNSRKSTDWVTYIIKSSLNRFLDC